MNKKIILGLSVLLVALFALIGGASYAWLTSTGAGDSNTYKVGEVKFEITATETTGLVVPGQPLFSNVSITNTSSVTSHLRVSFSVSAKAANGDNLDWSIGSDAANDEILIDATAVSGWEKQTETREGVAVELFYYGTKAEPTNIAANGAVTLNFSGLKLNGNLVGNDHSGATVIVTVNFEAKQAEYVTWEQLASVDFEKGI